MESTVEACLTNVHSVAVRNIKRSSGIVVKRSIAIPTEVCRCLVNAVSRDIRPLVIGAV